MHGSLRPTQDRHAGVGLAQANKNNRRISAHAQRRRRDQLVAWQRHERAQDCARGSPQVCLLRGAQVDSYGRRKAPGSDHGREVRVWFDGGRNGSNDYLSVRSKTTFHFDLV